MLPSLHPSFRPSLLLSAAGMNHCTQCTSISTIFLPEEHARSHARHVPQPLKQQGMTHHAGAPLLFVVCFFFSLRRVTIDKARFLTPKLPPSPPPSSLYTQTVSAGPVPINRSARRDSGEVAEADRVSLNAARSRRGPCHTDSARG